MLKYTLYVHIKGESSISIDIEPENDYQLRKNITSIGVNGITQNDGDNIIYYPPHKIAKIDAVVRKD